MLDIGCGSGILTVAARKLGASPAYGVDIDPAAVEIARQTAHANQVSDNLRFETGSVAEVRSGLLPVRQASVVIANILTHILVRLLDEGMADLVSPGGVLLLSGILEEKMEEMQTALEKQGLEIKEKLMIEDWVGLAVKPSGAN